MNHLMSSQCDSCNLAQKPINQKFPRIDMQQVQQPNGNNSLSEELRKLVEMDGSDGWMGNTA